MLVIMTANILEFQNDTQVPSQVETITTDGQGHPINVYFVWKIRILKHVCQFWCILP